ncbi:superinfection immunity protein [Caulobacter sp. 17J65-9]|uniref:superinfection immunity protein n=1 Tax=Caulobacter sp. 17J65-9 TaxID=2709382 RepID=UPI001969F620|nr:superinfection immunity protein [Caulobacter sp. 17J65-9]
MGSFSLFHYLIVLVVLALLMAPYMLPGILALARKHPRKGAIIALNFFLGWSVLGWFGALVWALTTPNETAA